MQAVDEAFEELFLILERHALRHLYCLLYIGVGSLDLLERMVIVECGYIRDKVCQLCIRCLDFCDLRLYGSILLRHLIVLLPLLEVTQLCEVDILGICGCLWFKRLSLLLDILEPCTAFCQHLLRIFPARQPSEFGFLGGMSLVRSLIYPLLTGHALLHDLLLLVDDLLESLQVE